MSNDGGREASRAQEPVAESTEKNAASLLQQMLETTLMDRKGQLTSNEWTALRAIAIRAHSGGLGMAEFVEALVGELLSSRFEHLKRDPTIFSRMCRKIAETLSADPHARQKLREFQQHLLQATS